MQFTNEHAETLIEIATIVKRMDEELLGRPNGRVAQIEKEVEDLKSSRTFTQGVLWVLGVVLSFVGFTEWQKLFGLGGK